MNYQMVIKIPMTEMDDIAARKKAKEIIATLPNIDKTVKLQRLEGNKPPTGISFIHEGENNGKSNYQN